METTPNYTLRRAGAAGGMLLAILAANEFYETIDRPDCTWGQSVEAKTGDTIDELKQRHVTVPDGSRFVDLRTVDAQIIRYYRQLNNSGDAYTLEYAQIPEGDLRPGDTVILPSSCED